MARADLGIFGNMRGRIGDYSVRTVNGKTIIAARPKNVKVSNAPKCVETRQKFSVTVALARVVSNLPTLRQIWKLNRNTNLSAFNQIFKYNFEFSSTLAPTLNNIITPDGFKSQVIDVFITEDKLTGSLKGFDKNISLSSDETDLSINAVVSLSGPKEEGEPFYQLISLSKEIAEFDFSKQYDFEFGLNPVQADIVSKYNQKIIYLAVATKTIYKEIIRYSKSYSKTLAE